jgi:hypothetical protein
MNGFRHLMLRTTSDRIRSLVLCVALSACVVGHFDPAVAQTATPPPLIPPLTSALPSGVGSLTLGQWLLTPTLGLYGLYDTNVHSNVTAPLSGPGFHIHPALLADFNTGIFDTSLYGNIDSVIYPTLDPANNTFDRQAGFIQKYSPLPDLVFSAQGDYTHTTNANVISNSTTPSVSSSSTPITSPASPALPGAAGVTASQQTVVDPNDTYTGTVGVYKEFNRAFIRLGASIAETNYEMASTSDYGLKTYNGSGAYWLTPLLFAFGNGSQSFETPAVGSAESFYQARGGIGSDKISFFQGSIYYGQQGTEVADGGGAAGGNLYGGIISYYPTDPWNMSFAVDRYRNISNITSTTNLAQGGLGLAGAGISASDSTQSTAFTFRSNYQFSAQTTVFGVVSDTHIEFIGQPWVVNSWLASMGIRHQLRQNVSLSLDYQYIRYISNEPLTSFTRNLVSVGAIYSF